MQKPDDIPEDIWVAAALPPDYFSRRQEHVARAILAERERCVKVIKQDGDAREGQEHWAMAQYFANLLRLSTPPIERAREVK